MITKQTIAELYKKYRRCPKNLEERQRQTVGGQRIRPLLGRPDPDSATGARARLPFRTLTALRSRCWHRRTMSVLPGWVMDMIQKAIRSSSETTFSDAHRAIPAPSWP